MYRVTSIIKTLEDRESVLSKMHLLLDHISLDYEYWNTIISSLKPRNYLRHLPPCMVKNMVPRFRFTLSILLAQISKTTELLYLQRKYNRRWWHMGTIPYPTPTTNSYAYSHPSFEPYLGQPLTLTLLFNTKYKPERIFVSLPCRYHHWIFWCDHTDTK